MGVRTSWTPHLDPRLRPCAVDVWPRATKAARELNILHVEYFGARVASFSLCAEKLLPWRAVEGAAHSSRGR